MSRFTRVVGILIGMAFILPACAPTGTHPPPTSAPTPTPSATPALPPSILTPLPEPRVWELGKSYFNVHYCTDGDTPLTMTLIVPAEPLREPPPVLIHLKFASDLIQPLVRRGFAVISLEWHEPPAFKLPIGVMEVKCAVRSLRANAARYRVDTDQIGLFGCSRGGHTAALAALTGPEDDMEGDFGFAEESSRVQAVVSFDGIADFRTNYADVPSELASVHGIESFDDPMIERLSPIIYASLDDPPVLLIASRHEHWQKQAYQLEEALTAQGVPVTYLQAEGADHCMWSFSGPHTLEGMTEIIADFFEENLK